MDQTAIAVSRLCCPVCWELLDVLKGPDDQFNRFGVRGRHPTVYPVELPPWLPRNVLEEMVTRFERILTEKISNMVRFDREKKRRRHKSRRASESEQSDSAVSTGSHQENLSGVDRLFWADDSDTPW